MPYISTRNAVPLPHAHNTKDLEVTMDCSLSSSYQIDAVVTNVRGMLVFLRHTFRRLSLDFSSLVCNNGRFSPRMLSAGADCKGGYGVI